MIEINLKECELKNNSYKNIKNWIDEAKRDSGYLSEMITYIYYRCIKGYEVWHTEGMQSQNDLGDFIVYDGIQPFYIDSKSSTLYKDQPKAWVDLSYWKYSTDSNIKYYGIKAKKEHNYGWLYELKYCSKLFYYNRDLKQCFIIEDFQVFKNTLLNEYLTKNLRPEKYKIWNFNNLMYKQHSIENAITVCEKPEKVREPTDTGYIEYDKVTEGLAILLIEEVINALGSELTIIQLEY